MTERIIEDRIPWITVIASIIVVAILMPLLHLFTAEANYGNIATAGQLTNYFGTSFMPIAMFVMSLSGYAIMAKSATLSKYLDPRKMVYVLTVVMLGVSSATLFPVNTFAVVFRGRYLRPLDEGAFIPEWWIPDEATLTSLFEPGTVNWGNWTAPWMAFVAFMLANSFVFIALNTIFRRQWIDVERLPYPATQAYLSLVEIGQEEEEQRYSRKMIFAAGWIVGAGFFGLLSAHALFPAFPDPINWFSGWRQGWGGAQFPGVVTLNHASQLPALLFFVPKLRWSWNPAMIALAYFVPMDALFTGWIFWLVFEVAIGQWLWQIGVYSSNPWAWMTEPPLRYSNVANGMIYGLIIWWVVFNYKYIATTIRLAIGQGDAAERELEKGDVPYKVSYLLLIVGLVLLVGMNSAFQMWPLLNLVFTLGWIVAIMGWARASGVTPFLGAADQPLSGPAWTRIAIGNEITYETMSTGQFMSSMFADTHASLNQGWLFQAYQAGAAYKAGSMLKVSNFNLFKVMLLASTIIPIIAYPVFIQTAGTFGLFNMQANLGGATYFGRPEKFNNSFGAPPYEPYTLAGILIVGAIILAKTRFAWFPLNPAAAAVGISGNFWERGMPSHFLWAWVFKFLTYRIGGARAYRGYGVPFAAGILAGYVLLVVIMGPLTALRFFFPA